jgi:hypothetical protein
MGGRTMIVAGLAVFVGLVTSPAWVGTGHGVPDLVLPAGFAACVEPKATIRREHPALLSRWRDSVVRDSQEMYRTSDGRDVRMSLSGTCLGCHTEPAKFCDRCHDWVGVHPKCFGCHVRPMENPR